MLVALHNAAMIAETEDAIIAHIKAQSFGYSLPVVESYAGELSGKEPDMVKLMSRLPAVWATFGGEAGPKSYDTQRKAWLMPCKFYVFVCTKNLRGRSFGRLGGSVAEMGAYDIAEDIRAALITQDFGLPIDFIQPGPIKTLFNIRIQGNPLSALSVELNTKYVVKKADPAAGDWLRIGVNYDLTPPGDGITDASDLITLREP